MNRRDFIATVAGSAVAGVVINGPGIVTNPYTGHPVLVSGSYDFRPSYFGPPVHSGSCGPNCPCHRMMEVSISG
jgi:hypothetical protein